MTGVQQDGSLIVKFNDDTEPAEFGFNEIKGWQLWGPWLVIKYTNHRTMYSQDVIEWLDVHYNSDEVTKALAEAHDEKNDAISTRYSCVSCHEKIRIFHG